MLLSLVPLRARILKDNLDEEAEEYLNAYPRQVIPIHSFEHSISSPIRCRRTQRRMSVIPIQTLGITKSCLQIAIAR